MEIPKSLKEKYALELGAVHEHYHQRYTEWREAGNTQKQAMDMLDMRIQHDAEFSPKGQRGKRGLRGLRGCRGVKS